MRNFFINNMFFRIIICLMSVLVLMFFCIVRLVDLSSTNFDVKAGGVSNGYTVEINDGRGNIYDCNGEKITGEKTVYYVVFLPCDEAILRFVQLTYGTERAEGLAKLRSKKVAIIKSDAKITGVGIYSYKSSERYSNALGLEHLVGYVGTEGDGITGLEKSYNSILSVKESTEIFFETSASQRFNFYTF